MTASNGLLHRAKDLIASRAPLRLLRPDELRDEQDEEISPEDREKILQQIEKVLASSRIRVTPETMRFTPRRRGGRLPLLVNAIAVVVIAGGIFLAFYFSRMSEQTIISAPVQLQTAEGKLLEAARQESAQQLASKDQEISSIRQKLAGLDTEKDRLRLAADAQVQQRTQELQAVMDQELAAERARLEASGLSAAAVDRKIAELEARQTAAHAAELAALRVQADADRAEKERALDKLRADYQQSLSNAQTERVRLETEAARKQGELEAGYLARQQALEKDKAQTSQELENLRRQQEKEQMVLDQLLTFYGGARDALQAGRPADAAKVLTDFRSFLAQPAVAALPAIERRRTVDLFLIDALEGVIRSQAADSATATSLQTLAASADLITAVASLVQQGDALFQQQDYTRARDLYVSALARIPAVQLGYGKLASIEQVFANQKKKGVADLLAAGNAAYKAADYGRAVDSYGKALAALQGERSVTDALVANLLQIGSILNPPPPDPRLATLLADAERRAALRAELATLAGEYRQSAAQSSGAPTRETLVALLESKLLVQKVLLSKDVLAKYPDLYEKLDLYLEALVAETRDETRTSVLHELDARLSTMIQKSGATGANPADASANGTDPLLSIMDKLSILLQ